MTVTLYHCPQTRSSGALWLLEELGAPYEIVHVDVRKGPAEDFIKINPSGKVPAIRHKGQSLGELAAISLYLCDEFPDAGLAPEFGSPQRAAHYFWHVFRPGVLEPAMMAKSQGWSAERGTAGWGDFENMISRIERVLETSEYLLGDAFSASDILVGGALGWVRRFGLIEDHDTIFAYIDRIEDRDAFRRVQEIDAKMAGAS